MLSSWLKAYVAPCKHAAFSTVVCKGLGPYRRVDSTIARYILPLTCMDTWSLFQSLWRSRPKDALTLAILLCISSSMHPLVDVVLPRKVNSRTEFNLFQSTMISFSRVLVEFGWYNTWVLFMFIFRPNFFDGSENASKMFYISSAECVTSALSSANSSSLISVRRWIGQRSVWTPPTMSRKASSSITDSKMEKSVGASTQTCLTLFVTIPRLLLKH